MIHFLTPEYPPRHGGVADYTHQIATELSRGGETVHVWGPSGSAAQPGSAIVVHPDLGRFRAADLQARERPARRVSLSEAIGRAVGAAWIRTARDESAVLPLVVAEVGRRRFD